MLKTNPDKIGHTRVFTTWIESGICRTKVSPNAVIHLSDAQENTRLVGELTNEELFPLLVDLRQIVSIDRDARDHFAMRDRRPKVSAIAMLIESPLSRVIGNFFLGINMPAVPTRLFTSEKKAQDWLKKYIAAK